MPSIRIFKIYKYPCSTKYNMISYYEQNQSKSYFFEGKFFIFRFLHEHVH